MKLFRAIFGGIAFALLTSGCASGVPYASMVSSIPPLKDGEGRIFFFRSGSMVGAAVTSDIQLNGEIVGKSQSGGFFFVDRPAGSYTAATSTEVEKSLSFALDSGEIKYVRSSISMGVLVGRVVLELEAPESARNELADLKFTGHLSRSAVARNTMATTAKASPSPTGKVTLDDLRGLLPAK
jgi:hypothetical protein